MFAKLWKSLPPLAAVTGLIVGSIGMNQTFARAEELEHRAYKVGYVQDRTPVSLMDENGEFQGITRYILDRIEELADIDFEYVALPTGSVTYDYLNREGFDLVTNVEYNKENQKARGILMSNPYLSSQKVIVAREGTEFAYNSKLKVAVSTGSQTLKKVLADTYPNFELVDYDSIGDCLDALNKGEADLVIQNQFVVEYWLMRPSYGSLKVVPIMGLNDELCFSAVVPLEVSDSEEWRQKELLIDKINDAISQISEDETAMYIIEATMENQYKFTASDFLYRYRYAAAALLFTAFLIVVLLFLLLRVRLRSLEDRADARAKGRFLSTMSHEIRTPLNGLIGLNYLMSQNLDDKGKVDNYLRQSTETAKYLMSLVDDILDMSRLQEQSMKLEMSRVNLRLLVSTVGAILKGSLDEKRIDFQIDSELPYPGIVGDQIRIQQVLLNVLDNSRKFTPEGGQVVLTARQELMEDEKVKTTFCVRDNGCGMSEEFQKHIFDSFAQELGTVSKGNQGTGLGMAISYRLARLMDGDLAVRSRKGEGTEVVFSFPAELAIYDDGEMGWEPEPENEDWPHRDSSGSSKLAADAESGSLVQDSADTGRGAAAHMSGRGESPSAEESKAGRMRVLIAEDNELNAEILLELLMDADVDVDLAKDGQEAVQRFAASEIGEYRVILMDLLMPKMDGFEAAKAIRSMKREDASVVQIYACTANSFQEDRERAMKSGMNDFITKPIDIGKLLEKLEKLKKA